MKTSTQQDTGHPEWLKLEEIAIEATLTRIYFKLSPVKKRVFNFIISQLDREQFNDYQPLDIKLRAQDYAKAFGIDDSQAYEELKEALDSLLKQVIAVNHDDHIIKIPLLFCATFHDSKFELTMRLHSELIHHFMAFKKFVSNLPPMVNEASFNSLYSWHLMRLFMDNAQDKSLTGGYFAGWFTIDIDDFRKKMAVPESINFGMLRCRIIERSQQELLEKAGIASEVSYEKIGRKVKTLKFEFLEKRALDEDDD